MVRIFAATERERRRHQLRVQIGEELRLGSLMSVRKQHLDTWASARLKLVTERERTTHRAALDMGLGLSYGKNGFGRGVRKRLENKAAAQQLREANSLKFGIWTIKGPTATCQHPRSYFVQCQDFPYIDLTIWANRTSFDLHKWAAPHWNRRKFR